MEACVIPWVFGKSFHLYRATVSFRRHDLESPGKRVSMEDCLDGLTSECTCWERSLNLIDQENPVHYGWHHSLPRDSPEHMNGRKEIKLNSSKRTSKKCTCSLPSGLDCGWWAWSPCHLGFPFTMGDNQSLSLGTPFLLWVAVLSGCFITVTER